jgi:hypothetical protein
MTLYWTRVEENKEGMRLALQLVLEDLGDAFSPDVTVRRRSLMGASYNLRKIARRLDKLAAKEIPTPPKRV